MITTYFVQFIDAGNCDICEIEAGGATSFGHALDIAQSAIDSRALRDAVEIRVRAEVHD